MPLVKIYDDEQPSDPSAEPIIHYSLGNAILLVAVWAAICFRLSKISGSRSVQMEAELETRPTTKTVAEVTALLVVGLIAAFILEG